MKKYIITVIVIALIIFSYIFLKYNFSLKITIKTNNNPNTFMTTSNKDIIMTKNNKQEVFEIKGVDLGSGIPGHFSTEYKIDKDTYLKWFKEIQDMGANTIRVYTILNDDFYDAFYEYNVNNKNPLYLIQGVWVNDYTLNSRYDAYSKEFYNVFLKETKKMIDVIHGRKWITAGNSSGTGMYTKNISDWVIGYILGVEWEDRTVTHTNIQHENKEQYKGKYMYTEDASPFEIFLAQIGDQAIEYETNKYNEQRLVAFANWPTTDPFDYDTTVINYSKKNAKIDIEHIKTTDKFKSGTFASYHVYSYYPDYLYYGNMLDENGNAITLSAEEKEDTYKTYLKYLNNHHTIPVVISEFGNPTSRGMAQKEHIKGRNQGYLSEDEQGDALISEMEDMKEVGINNYLIFSWQDEWFKRTWNTMQNIDLQNTAYWSDAQANEQHFGLLTFDTGTKKSKSYVDGDTSEWTKKDIVSKTKNKTLSMKYDEEYVYFYVNIKDYNNEEVYIPIDTISGQGGKSINNFNVSFNRYADFVIYIHNKDDSRIYVHDRYNTVNALYGYEIKNINSYNNPPKKKSNSFSQIDLVLQIGPVINRQLNIETYETGNLTYGNANPSSEDYNSLADYIVNGDNIEIRIPWELLNFYTPAKMTIHDDYYKNYGIKSKKIKEMYVGLGTNTDNVNMKSFKLKAWNEKVTYHERLKKSYYKIQKYWSD